MLVQIAVLTAQGEHWSHVTKLHICMECCRLSAAEFASFRLSTHHPIRFITSPAAACCVYCINWHRACILHCNKMQSLMNYAACAVARLTHQSWVLPIPAYCNLPMQPKCNSGHPGPDTAACGRKETGRAQSQETMTLALAKIKAAQCVVIY